MMNFWRENRKTVGKLYVNQFALILFSLMVTSFVGKNDFTMLFGGLFTMAFYWYLIYTMMWMVGAKDRIQVDSGRTKRKLSKGFVLSLFANAINFVCAVIYLICYLNSGYSVHNIARLISYIGQFMYSGWWMYFMPRNPMAHFIVMIPTIVVTGVSYIIGYHNFYLRSLFHIKVKPQKPS